MGGECLVWRGPEAAIMNVFRNMKRFHMQEKLSFFMGQGRTKVTDDQKKKKLSLKN
jgi:hypothetical protein